MSRLSLALVCAAFVAACQGAGPSPSPQATAASAPPRASPSASAPPAEPSQVDDARELPASGRLDAGRYIRAAFRPPISFTLEDGWSVGSVTTGFFDVQQQKGTPDVIAVQFASVDRIVGAGREPAAATSAADAAATIAENPGLTVLGESDSRLGGLSGFTIEVENAGDVHVGILDVAPGRLGIDPARRLWISVFDTAEGILAIMVGGSTADWDHALLVAEPVLESVVIG